MSRRTILVAEDDDAARAVLCDLCRIFGYEVEGVGNGVEAMQAVARGGFDLVLMDCDMPVMGGLEATRRIRAAEATRPVVIVAVTGGYEAEECLAAGMDDHLAKPVPPHQLRIALRRWLDAKRPSQRLASPRT